MSLEDYLVINNNFKDYFKFPSNVYTVENNHIGNSYLIEEISLLNDYVDEFVIFERFIISFALISIKSWIW